jgi:hypothetical protein
MIIPVLHSGLGNQLFQLSAGFATAKKLNVPFGINRGMHIQSSHTALNYMNTIYKKALEKYESEYGANECIHFPTDLIGDEARQEIKQLLNSGSCPIVGITGYFAFEAEFRGYRNEIAALLDYGDVSRVDAMDLGRAFFIHFRRGDFLNTDFWTDLTKYHLRAIERVLSEVPDAVFYILSDDIEYCRTNIEYLQNKNCVFVDGLNEIETLYLMKQCGLGGASANSTFSWWGLYLNLMRPYLFIPGDTPKYPDAQLTFPEAQIISSV